MVLDSRDDSYSKKAVDCSETRNHESSNRIVSQDLYVSTFVKKNLEKERADKLFKEERERKKHEYMNKTKEETLKRARIAAKLRVEKERLLIVQERETADSIRELIAMRAEDKIYSVHRPIPNNSVLVSTIHYPKKVQKTVIKVSNNSEETESLYAPIKLPTNNPPLLERQVFGTNFYQRGNFVIIFS